MISLENRYRIEIAIKEWPLIDFVKDAFTSLVSQIVAVVVVLCAHFDIQWLGDDQKAEEIYKKRL